MRRPILIRSLALGGAAALALAMAGCGANEPSAAPATAAPLTSAGPALPTSSPPALAQLDLGAWGARVMPARDGATRSTGQVVPGRQSPPVEITQKSGSWTLDVACIAGDGISLTVTLNSGSSKQTQDLPCAPDARADAKVITLRYDGGAQTTLTVTAAGQVGFVVQSAQT